MQCSIFRELISADLDGELDADEHVVLTAHLRRCKACTAYAERAGTMHRAMRVRAAPEVPDLADAILAAAGPLPASSQAPGRWPMVVRWATALVGAVQLSLALPDLVMHHDTAEDLHALHHLNAWAVAFAVGLVVVAWQPERVRGFLPVAEALVGVMVFTVDLDMTKDHEVAMPYTAHLLEVSGLVLAWALARLSRPRRDPGDRSVRSRLASWRPSPWPTAGRFPVAAPRRNVAARAGTSERAA